jgi:predicted nuclease of predicted toxin-antitoxin system
MRLLADENIPKVIIEALRTSGHDVLAVIDRHAGIPDEAVLELASREQRILVTMDKGFGDRAIQKPLTVSAGIILLRLQMPPTEMAALVLARLSMAKEWDRLLSVIDQRGVRHRPLHEGR